MTFQRQYFSRVIKISTFMIGLIVCSGCSDLTEGVDNFINNGKKVVYPESMQIDDAMNIINPYRQQIDRLQERALEIFAMNERVLSAMKNKSIGSPLSENVQRDAERVEKYLHEHTVEWNELKKTIAEQCSAAGISRKAANKAWKEFARDDLFYLASA